MDEATEPLSALPPRPESEVRRVRRSSFYFRHNVLLATVFFGFVVAVSWVFLLQPALRSSSTKKLRFRSVVTEGETSNSFRILQIADIHLGEAEDTDWGPQQDVKTWAVLETLIDLERPDLVVLTGDQVTANDSDYNATSYNRQLGKFLTSRYPEIPFASLYGNHDDLEYQKNGMTHPPRFTRPDLYKVDRSFPRSLISTNPDLYGVSNYILDVYFEDDDDDNNNEDDLAMQIFVLDSGGGNIDKRMTQEQLDWLQYVSDPSVPAVAFQHIPTVQFQYDQSTCVGSNYDGGIDEIPEENEAGIVATLRDMGRVAFLAVGHNHGNDYCCPVSENDDTTTTSTIDPPYLHLCFGRHSGYGGYGSWERGARVYELSALRSESNSGDVILQWKSWVHLESGRRIHRLPSTDDDYGDDDDGS